MFGKKAFFPLVLIIVSLVLFVFNLLEIGKSNHAIWGLLSNILLIIAMVLVMLENKKKTKK